MAEIGDFLAPEIINLANGIVYVECISNGSLSMHACEGSFR